MKFTLNWLREFVTFRASPQKLAELLTMAGLEVDSITPLREPETDREDWLFEISVTPNRGDCLGITGLATEVSALTGGRVKSTPSDSPRRGTRMAGRADVQSGINRVSIAIQNSRLCPRYSAKIVDEVRMGPSPVWMRFRLESCGIRSINNVVDVTNYIMLETGQPLHAFDLERLPSRQIVVRPANEIETFTTLDGVERKLAAEDLLICDGDVPIALAGVMGGTNSEVTSETRSILVESANFDPIAVRRTAKRLGLHSEASHRFERGVDPEGTLPALNRAAELLVLAAKATPVAGVADRYPGRRKPLTLFLRNKRVEEILGVRIGAPEARKLLRSLELKTRQASSGKIKVVVPTRRTDLTREADLIEELARLYGYQRIPSNLPRLRSLGGQKDDRLAQERKVRSFLAGKGLFEVINFPFTTEKLNRLCAGVGDGGASPVEVLNPIAKESAEMRLSLLPGLVENLRTNLAQHAESFWAYHLGKAFRLGRDGSPEERQLLSGVLYGPRARRGLHRGSESALSFLECKGLVEGILDLLRMGETVEWSRESSALLHPGKAAALIRDGKKLGTLGEVHPDVSDTLGVVPVFLVFELDFDGLLQYAPRRITARSLPRFPSVERDFAIVVEGEFPSQQIISWIKNRGEALIEYVEVFDQYVGASIPAGKKSLAYKISYRADDRTLTDTEVNTLHQSLVEQIAKFFGAQVRS